MNISNIDLSDITILSQNPYPHWMVLDGDRNKKLTPTSPAHTDGVPARVEAWCREFCQGDFMISTSHISFVVFSPPANRINPITRRPKSIMEEQVKYCVLIAFEQENDAMAFKLSFEGNQNGQS